MPTIDNFRTEYRWLVATKQAVESERDRLDQRVQAYQQRIAALVAQHPECATHEPAPEPPPDALIATPVPELATAIHAGETPCRPRTSQRSQPDTPTMSDAGSGMSARELAREYALVVFANDHAPATWLAPISVTQAALQRGWVTDSTNPERYMGDVLRAAAAEGTVTMTKAGHGHVYRLTQAGRGAATRSPLARPATASDRHDGSASNQLRAPK